MPESYLSHLLIELAVLTVVMVSGGAIWLLACTVSKRVNEFRPSAALLALLGIWFISCTGMVARLYGPLRGNDTPLYAFAGLLLIGGLAWYLRRERMSTFWSRADLRHLLYALVFLIPFNTGVWGWDAGLYHIGKGFQFEQLENITGLGLLNTRFGFNPITDIWHGLMLSFDLGLFSFWLVNDIVLIILVLFLLEVLGTSGTRRDTLAVAAFVLVMVLSGGTSNFADRGLADFSVLSFIAIAYLSLMLLMVRSPQGTVIGKDRDLRLFCIGALAIVLACVVKVSAAPVFCFFLLWWLVQLVQGNRVKSGLALLVPAVLISGLWLQINHQISGCWVYPVDWTCASMENPQVVGGHAALHEQKIITHHARAPIHEPVAAFMTLGGHPNWPEYWWQVNAGSPYVWCIILGAVGSFLLLVGLWARRILSRSTQSTVSLTGTSLPGKTLFFIAMVLHTLFWWFTAPEIRYAMFLPIFWLALLLVLVVDWIPENVFSLAPLNRFATPIVVFALFIGLMASESMFNTPADVPEPQLGSTTSRSGLEVAIAWPDIRCWDADIPCTNALMYDWETRLSYDPVRGYYLEHP